MKTPGFWYRTPPTYLGRIAAGILSPIGAVIGGVTARRMARAPSARLSIPVICVGNFTAGGAGKTPIALAIHGLLAAHDRKCVFLTRGHGGAIDGPVQVDRARHTARDVGDEPLLLASIAPTFVSKDRAAAAGLIGGLSERPDVVIMDDGLQSATLEQTVRMAVVDADVGLGNGRCIPAGPLRAPIDGQLNHVDAVIAYGTKGANTDPIDAGDKPVFRAHPETHLVRVDGGPIDHKPLLGFCGIGRPDKFFSALGQEGLPIERTLSFADHHPYVARDLDRIATLVKRHDLTPVTTAKDAIRLKGMAIPQVLAERLHVLDLIAVFERPQTVTRFLLERIVETKSLRSW